MAGQSSGPAIDQRCVNTIASSSWIDGLGRPSHLGQGDFFSGASEPGIRLGDLAHEEVVRARTLGEF
jgi:hypothetical protein